MTTSTPITPKMLAADWDTDARTVRKFLRSPQGTGKVGQGNRHEIDPRSVKRLHKAFLAWNEAKARPAADDAVEVEEVEEVEAIDET